MHVKVVCTVLLLSHVPLCVWVCVCTKVSSHNLSVRPLMGNLGCFQFLPLMNKHIGTFVLKSFCSISLPLSEDL